MPRIYYYDKFKICREFIIMINSDVFKNLLIYSKFKGGAMLLYVYTCNSVGKRPSLRLSPMNNCNFLKKCPSCCNHFLKFQEIYLNHTVSVFEILGISRNFKEFRKSTRRLLLNIEVIHAALRLL